MQFQKISILPPRKVFCFAPLLPPGNSSLASYFASKILVSKTPLPLGISNDLSWGGYGFFMRLNEILAKLKSSQCCHFSRIRWWWGGGGGVQGSVQRHCHVLLLEFALLPVAGLLAFPSLPPTLWLLLSCHGGLLTAEEIASLLCCYLYGTYPPIIQLA